MTPRLGYGSQASDKVPANSTLYFLTNLDAVVRVTKVGQRQGQDDRRLVQTPRGGDCDERVKARPGQDVTMKIKVMPHTSFYFLLLRLE